MLDWIRFVLTAALLAAGLFLLITGVVAQYRFKYVLNRMHAAALGDTMGIMLMMLGLAVANGMNVLSLKLLLLILLFWTASPVASHLIGRLELVTNEELIREVRLWKR